MPKWQQKLVRLCLLVLLFLAASKGLFELGRIILLESQGPLDADSTIYFTIGRGILNGYKLYTSDFFDVQPPGIFLLTAASLLVTGDQRLATWLAVASLVALPVALSIVAFRKSRPSEPIFRAILTLFALTLGILITLYLEERVPTIETQLFGGVLGALFALVMIGYPDRFDGKRSMLAGVLLLGSIGIKEPFLLTNLAAALLLARHRKHFLHAFLLPLGIAGLLGIVILFGMGILVPYIKSFSVTLTYRGGSLADQFGPIAIRPLAVRMLHKNMTLLYAHSPLFAYVLWFLWSRCPAYHGQKNSAVRLSATIYLFLGFAAGALLMNTAYQLLFARYIALEGLKILDPFFIRHTLETFVLAIVLLPPTLFWIYRRHMVPRFALSLIALGLTSLSVGSSMYSGNHFGFAIPVYAALALLFVQESAHHKKITPSFLMGSILTIFAMGMFTANPKHIAYLQNRMGFTYAAQKERIERLDALMDRCVLERYYNEAMAELAMARHSPFGPMVMQFDSLPKDHPLHQKTVDNVLEHARLVVAAEDYENPDPSPTKNLMISKLREHIPKEFTKEPPPCATPFEPIEGFTVWFRRDLF